MQNRASESKSMLTVQQVADRLGVSYDHVTTLIKRGKLRAVDLGNGSQHCYRIDATWIEDLIAASAPTSPKTPKRDNGNLRPSKFSAIGVTR